MNGAGDRLHDACAPEVWLEANLAEITRYCQRLLGSAVDADDAAQDTLVRAWQSFDRFESRSSLRSWLYRIATNVCIDAHRGRYRRAEPIDLSLARIPAASVVQPGDDPADLAVSRDSVRLALVAALIHLPQRQRAVLILRDVLSWSAAEVADRLGVSVAAVNSTLQRARASVGARAPAASTPSHLEDDRGRLLARYLDAFEHYDVDALVEGLCDDAGVAARQSC
jgi:RNA polymerase sigma-70 factor, ECF subfamily